MNQTVIHDEIRITLPEGFHQMDAEEKYAFTAFFCFADHRLLHLAGKQHIIFLE